MKNTRALVLVSFLCIATQSASAAMARPYGLGFVVPQVSDKSHVANPTTGELVFDQIDGTFYGRDNSSNWVAFNAPAGSFVPTGTIFPYAGTTPPAGYLICDGSAVSKTTYAALYALITTTYGAGDTNNFVLPDLRGMFVRGAGTHGSTLNGKTPSATHGAQQGDATAKNGLGLSDPGHQHAIQRTNGSGVNVGLAGGYIAYGSLVSGYQGVVEPTSASYTNVSLGNGDSETRPANLALTYIIKY
jgi:microcystin-dependent protein